MQRAKGNRMGQRDPERGVRKPGSFPNSAPDFLAACWTYPLFPPGLPSSLTSKKSTLQVRALFALKCMNLPNERVGLWKERSVSFFNSVMSNKDRLPRKVQGAFTYPLWGSLLLPPTLNIGGLDGFCSSFMLSCSLILWFYEQRHALFSILNHLISSRETRIKMVLPFLAAVFFFSLWITLTIYLRWSVWGQGCPRLCICLWLQCRWVCNNA